MFVFQSSLEMRLQSEFRIWPFFSSNQSRPVGTWLILYSPCMMSSTWSGGCIMWAVMWSDVSYPFDIILVCSLQNLHVLLVLVKCGQGQIVFRTIVAKKIVSMYVYGLTKMVKSRAFDEHLNVWIQEMSWWLIQCSKTSMKCHIVWDFWISIHV